MYEENLYYRRMNIWYYENGFSRSSAPLTQYEAVFWFSKSPKKWTYNVDDVNTLQKYRTSEKILYIIRIQRRTCKWEPNPLGAMRGTWAFQR